MKIVVVYESMFGNTRTIAEAIAKGLEGAGDVRLGAVDMFSPDDVRDAALIVAGGPTHAFGMMRRSTRQGAEKDRRYGSTVAGTTLLRDWIATLPPATTTVATFDTRFDKPAWLTGSAAKRIARHLARKDYRVVSLQSFFVIGTAGPLATGERERAVAWGRELAAQVKQPSAT